MEMCAYVYLNASSALSKEIERLPNLGRHMLNKISKV